MRKAVLFFALILLLLIFAVIALAGSESGENTYYGSSAGNTGGGTYNSSFGYYAGSLVTGSQNTFIGAYAGAINEALNNNTYIGFGTGYAGSNATCVGTEAGSTNYGNDVIFIGYRAGMLNTGHYNTFVGYQAGAGHTITGGKNTFIGYEAGYSNTSGYDNNFFGWNAGYNNSTGHDNIFIGDYAGNNNTSGYYNTFIGRTTGWGNTAGHNNTMIGYYANVASGMENASAVGSQAYAGASNTLVLGSISGVNGATSSVNVGIGTSTPVRQLHLVGDNATFRMDRTKDTAAFLMVRTDASGIPMKTFVVGTNSSASGVGEFVINDLGTAVSGGGANRFRIDNTGTVYVQSLVQTSSKAYKDNVRTYENALDTVSKLRGVKFDWKDSGKPSVGLIAEEVEKVIPEVVAHNEGNATGVNYASLVGVLVEAVKEQQGLIAKQQNDINVLQAKNSRLEELEQRILILEGK